MGSSGSWQTPVILFFKDLNETSGSIFYFWRDSPHWARVTSFTRFLDHTQLRTTFGRAPLDE